MTQSNACEHGHPLYRVYDLDEPLREAIRSRRASLGLSVAEFLAESVTQELPGLVRSLSDLGLVASPETGVRPARLPVSESILERLREAGGHVGLPASRLLLLCLARSAARKRRRSVRGLARADRG